MKETSLLRRILASLPLLALLSILSLMGGPSSMAQSDAVAPSVVTNLVAAAGSTAGTVELNWNAPGDDATAGTATTYIVRYNTTPITEDNWDASTDVTGEPTPSEAGSVETMTVSGLPTGQTYYFAIKTEDEVPNISSISNNAGVTLDFPAGLATYLPLVLRNGSSAEPVIPDTTEVLPGSTTQHLTSISGDGSTFTFSQSTPELNELAPGDVIVGDVSANAPTGFLRKVTTVSSPGGQVVVETAAATLEEAIESGSLDVSHTLTPDQIQTSSQLQGVSLIGIADLGGEFYYTLNDVVLYDADDNLNTKNDQIRADGSIRLAPGFDFNLDVDGFALQELYFAVGVTETAKLEIKAEVELASVEKSKEIARHTFSPITTFIGPVPVVMIPVLSVNVGLDGSIHVGVTTAFIQQASVTGGLAYANNSWSPVSDFSNQFSFEPPSLSAGLDVKGYTGPSTVPAALRRCRTSC
jgi:hypothetical protein